MDGAMSSRSPLLLTPSHWDQVLSLIHQGQEDEALFALIHIVQRMLHGKAPRRAIAEKANTAYVNSLFERVSIGVQGSLSECTAESVARLNQHLAEVRTKIAELRRFVQIELHGIEIQMERLKAQEQGADAGDAGSPKAIG
jgi:hypothetical protein